MSDKAENSEESTLPDTHLSQQRLDFPGLVGDDEDRGERQAEDTRLRDESKIEKLSREMEEAKKRLGDEN